MQKQDMLWDQRERNVPLQVAQPWIGSLPQSYSFLSHTPFLSAAIVNQDECVPKSHVFQQYNTFKVQN